MAAGFKKCTVASAKVAATLSNYPTYVDLSRVGITTLAEAQSVRVYADESQTTEWAREIVSATEMHVKIPSLTTTTTIYVDWDGSRSDYAVTDTYGRNAVWSDYARVFHGQSAVDATGNDAITYSSVTTNAQQIGDGMDFSGASGSYATITTGLGTFWNDNFTTSYWFRYDVNDATYSNVLLWPGDRNQQQIVSTTQKLQTTSWNGSTALSVTSSSTLTAGTRYHAVVQRTGASSGKIYLNGADDFATGSLNSPNNPGQAFRLGSRQDYTGANLDGQLDEVRMRAGVLSANWITTEYNNQLSESTFWPTWEDVGGGTTASHGMFAWF